ncbi:uncharacterized protein [Rutidosis leptorrhynchoides]|uniref:uncharacterized protein n=1 Tax=Rutidosis leptorrhynchoides TaxID=125765 RepID=UPI003A98F1EC
MMKQKARVKWALEGYENSKYFHNFVNRRANKNHIRGLPVNGNWNCSPQTIKEEMHNFFLKVFKDDDHEQGHFEFNISRISENDNLMLEGKFSEEEIWKAIKSCGSSKVSGPDGFNLKFYKKFWWLLKDDIVNMLDWFWYREEISKGCNASFITLILKNKNPLNLSDYRPIS